MKIENLEVGRIYTNNELMEIFECSNQGGIRFVTKKNHIVLISNYTSDKIENPYLDTWVNETLYYTGKGKKGDQVLKRENERLLKSKNRNTKIYYFEAFKKGEYTYFGPMKLASVYAEEQIQRDIDGNNRRVYIFKLKKK